MSAERDWGAIVAQLDRLTANAAEADRLGRGISWADIGHGFNRLAGLRKGVEPDYSSRGLGTAYVLYYLPRRAFGAMLAFADLSGVAESVRVLDIGAGTNATAVALSLTFPQSKFQVTAVEPSLEMAAAGSAAAKDLPNVVSMSVPATFEEVLDDIAIPGEEFDLLTMSAMLPYEWSKNTWAERIEFGERLARRILPGGSLVVIEPAAKEDELEALLLCLDRAGLSDLAILPASGFGRAEGASLRACEDLLDRWRPSIDDSGALEPWGWQMLDIVRRSGITLGRGNPDVLLYGTRRIGPAMIAPRVVRRADARVRPDVARPESERRTRVRSAVSLREWVLGAVLAAVAVAGLVTAVLRL